MFPHWILIGPEKAGLLEAKVHRELRPNHVLSGMKLEAVAMSTLADDVLFLTPSPRGPLALVHLTWGGKPDQHPDFPWTEFYDSWEAFREGVWEPQVADGE